jgi:hypothetical protein
MIFSVKPVLTEDLCVVQKEEFSIICYMCEIYIWRKAKRIHKRQTHLLVREMLHKDYCRKISVGEISGRGSLGTWRQNELIGCKPPVVKQLWLSVLSCNRIVAVCGWPWWISIVSRCYLATTNDRRIANRLCVCWSSSNLFIFYLINSIFTIYSQ